MRHPQNVFLIGPMGAGKSAVGRELARLLNRTFVDSDDELERRTGVDIPFIFEKEGEAGFRRREAAIIDELTQLENIVLATGGGAVLDPENRKHLVSRGTVMMEPPEPSRPRLIPIAIAPGQAKIEAATSAALPCRCGSPSGRIGGRHCTSVITTSQKNGKTGPKTDHVASLPPWAPKTVRDRSSDRRSNRNVEEREKCQTGKNW